MCILNVGYHDRKVVKGCVREGDPDALARHNSSIGRLDWLQYFLSKTGTIILGSKIPAVR